MAKKQSMDGFDKLLADNQQSTHYYEDRDANGEGVLRHWPELSAESKLHYIASAAAMYNVPYERFEQAARQAVGDKPLPAGEEAYLRLHMEYQQALWGPELPAFPREQPLPENEPHRDALETINGALTVKFYHLLDDYEKSKQPFPDADGRMRRWPELSAEGKVEHIARLAAIFSQPLSRFASAARVTIGDQPLHTDEDACMRLCYQYAQQIKDHEPPPLPLAQNADHRHAAPGQDPRFLANIDPVLTELEAFGDEFERLARNPEQRQLAADFKDWVHHTSRTFFIPGARTLAEKLFSETMPQPEAPPEYAHVRFAPGLPSGEGNQQQISHPHGDEPMAKKATTDDRTENHRIEGFKALADSAKSNSYQVGDTDGEYRYWKDLSAAGKVGHIARDAAYYNVPFEAFAQEVRDTLSHLPPAAREEAALRVAFHNEGELHQLGKLLPKHDRLEEYPLIDRLRDTLDDYRQTVAELEGEAKIGRALKETGTQTARQQDDNPVTLKDQLFGATLSAPAPKPAPQPEHSHQHKHTL